MARAQDEVIFAAVGDVHGMTHAMVRHLSAWERRAGRALDLVVQVGDMEPHRYENDLSGMAAPSKRKALGDFPDFYTGRARLPWPVLFIGGNHEPHFWLEEHPEGAELVPNAHYLGRAGWQDRCGLRVVGVSGIFVEGRFDVPRPPADHLWGVSNKEFVRFTADDIDRALEAGRADILLVHSWPAGFVDEADLPELSANTHRQVRRDPGSEPLRLLVELLRPRLVFCGHMHARFHKARVIDGAPVALHALGHLRHPDEAIACFAWDEHGPRLLR